jgi:hypothetical protein
MIFNLERQSSNAFFSDPVNSSNETIQLTGSPQTQGMNGDVYYYINAENDTTEDPAHKNGTPPILAIVSDTFWFFSVGQRGVYEKAVDWNECFRKNFPETFTRLAGQ